ncbi:MAG: PAS domain-containing sensor histidine kinase [Burkholderiales bacterium]|nr:PAS domain-containing sensor histidine kinase [Burkholderiales bacterium]
MPGSEEPPLRRRVSFPVAIQLILGLGLALLAGVAWLAHRNIGTLAQSTAAESEAVSGLARLEAALAAVRASQAALRRYAISERAEDRAAFAEAARRAAAVLDTLAAGVPPGEGRLRLSQLERTLRERLARMDRAAAARPPAAPPDAALEGESGRQELNLRAYLAASLQQSRAQARSTAGNSTFLIFWGTALAAALLAWAMVVIRRYHAGQEAAERATRASEVRLRQITDSVPALIGEADREGRLVFHNRAFEQWFGGSGGALPGMSPKGRPEGESSGAQRQRSPINLRELFGADAWRIASPHVQSVLEGRAAGFKFSWTPEGERAKDLSAQLAPRRDEWGAPAGYYVLVTDVSSLTEAQRLKAEFVSTVSHELRTPLTSIRGSLGLLAGGVTGPLPDAARELVSIAMNNCERLVRLVNDILDSERMSSGKLVLKVEALDLAALAARALRENEGFARSHGVSVTLDAPGPAPVRADPDRLLQVVTNLVSNACKFSPQGGVVEVGVEGGEERVKLTVGDRGPGIPVAFRQRIFGRFAQAESADTRRSGGTGLGLSICRGIIERLGGRIGFEERPGGGTTFWFELPSDRARGAGDAG